MRLAIGAAGRRQRLGDLAGVVGQHIHLRTRDLRVGEPAAHLGAQRRIGFHALAVVAVGQRLQHQPRRAVGLARRAARRQAGQHARAFGRGHELRFVGDPRIKGQHAPLGTADRLAGACVGEHGLGRPAARQPELQQLQHLRRIGFARQAGDLGAVGAHQHHRRVAAHLEAAAELLRAGPIAVDLHRHQRLAAFDEVMPVEQRGLQLIARRAPLRTPVQQDRLVLGTREHERALDVGIVGRRLPGHAVGSGQAAAQPRRGADQGLDQGSEAKSTEHGSSAWLTRTAALCDGGARRAHPHWRCPSGR